MPGPAPKRNPIYKRRPRPDWRRLPAAGRSGPVPRWPRGLGRVKGSADLWRELWASPQADAWADLGWVRVVARYTVLVLLAERPGAPVALLAEVRQLEDRLGLTPMAMRRLQWEIGDEAVVESRAGSEVAKIDDYREFFGAG